MTKFKNCRILCTLIDIDQSVMIFCFELTKFDHVVFDYTFTKHEFFFVLRTFRKFYKELMFSKKIKNQLYVFTMFIDKIEINDNVIKIKNNGFI